MDESISEHKIVHEALLGANISAKTLRNGRMNMKDTRVRETVFPVRIVKVFGTVQNAEALLKEKTLQITTAEPEVTTLVNDGEERAGVLLDFGKELHGSVRLLAFTGENKSTEQKAAGAYPVVRVSCGESVGEAIHPVGYKGSTNDHAVRDLTLPIPYYSDMTLCETGFRFVYVELQGEKATLRLKSVAAVSIYRDIPYVGTFRSNDAVLNQIYDVAAYTCHLSMQQYIWDGIKRDRLVWFGDLYPEMLTIQTVFGRQQVLEDSLRFAVESTPLPRWMNDFPAYSLWWIMLVHDWYFYTGESSLLEEFGDYAGKLLKQVCSYIADDGKDTLPAYFLDWPCRGLPQEKSGVRALLVLALQKGAAFATYCGEEETAYLCEKKAKAILATEEQSYGAKQVAAMLSLAGWYNHQAAAQEILEQGAKGWSTFMSYFLLKAAAFGDMSATLQALREYYGGMLEMGATTFWEDFNIDWMQNAARVDCFPEDGQTDIHGDNGAFCYKGYRHSLCHGWSSGPTAFLAEEVLGIRIAEIGCKKITLCPNLGDLEWVEGTYPLPQGILKVSHRRNAEGMVTTEYSAPDGVEVQVLYYNIKNALQQKG